MANFPLDPHEFLPPGFEIIDGGPTRLPRTFFSPAVTPDHHHEQFAIGIVEPPPPLGQIHHFCQLVSDFVMTQLHRDVLSDQQWIEGVGLFEFRTPASRHAIMNHPPMILAMATLFVSYHMIKALITELLRGFVVVGLCCWGFLWIITQPSISQMQLVLLYVFICGIRTILGWSGHWSMLLFHALNKFLEMLCIVNMLIFVPPVSLGLLLFMFYLRSSLIFCLLMKIRCPSMATRTPCLVRCSLFVMPEFPELGWNDPPEDPLGNQHLHQHEV